MSVKFATLDKAWLATLVFEGLLLPSVGRTDFFEWLGDKTPAESDYSIFDSLDPLLAFGRVTGSHF